MATFQPVEVVEVRMWGKRVGAVAADPAKGYFAFEYDKKWAKSGIELAPLHMPLAQAARPFIFTGLPQETYQRLPAMLADALPDRFGNALINAWMADKGVSAERVTALDRLAYMGKRGMGALEFKPARGSHTSSATALQLGSLINAVRKALEGSIKDDGVSKTSLTRIIQVGTSAGGARAKAAVAWNPETDELRAGQFDVPEGFEHWLLKFDGLVDDSDLGGSAGYGRTEYAYYLMAQAAGLDMNPCRLLEENGRAHFMTKRFDREGNMRIHMQTLCALDHLDYKQTGTHSYRQLFNVMERLGLGKDAMRQMLRRLVFNVMAVNFDDHTKNVSFLLPEGGQWQLAPAYDICFAWASDNKWINSHQMSVNGQYLDITREDIEQLAEQVGIRREVPIAIKAVGEAISRWADFAKQAGVSDKMFKSMNEQIQRIGMPLYLRK